MWFSRTSMFKPIGLCLTMALSACSIATTAAPDAAESDAASALVQSAAEPLLSPLDAVTYQTYELSQATVHVVTIDVHSAELSLAVADELETVAELAKREDAIAAINAGFFDPQNGKTTSYLIAEGEVVGDPADNERLMENPSLQTYLPSILDRSEFRQYRCSESGVPVYAIAPHSTPVPTNCQLSSAVGAGPQLLPQDISTTEAFTDYENGELIRDAIGSLQPNARSAVGIINTDQLVFIMAAQRQNAPGLTLLELAEFAQTLGVDTLLNLDGGSSSSLYYEGQTHLARLSASGNLVERPVKSVLIVK